MIFIEGFIAIVILWVSVAILMGFTLNSDKKPTPMVNENLKKIKDKVANKENGISYDFSSYEHLKSVRQIKEAIKNDKDKRPDNSFSDLCDMQQLIVSSFKDNKISVNIYNKFVDAYATIIDLIEETIKIRSSYKGLNKKNEFRIKLEEKRNRRLDEIEKLTSSLKQVVNDVLGEEKEEIGRFDKIDSLREEIEIHEAAKEKMNDLNDLLNGSVNLIKDSVSTEQPVKAIEYDKSSILYNLPTLQEEVCYVTRKNS